MKYSTYGRHIAVDIRGVDFNVLDNVDFLRLIIVDAAEKSHGTGIIRN
jgi:S-adenosylmethionine decarboxylase